jgi:hypothetical protein
MPICQIINMITWFSLTATPLAGVGGGSEAVQNTYIFTQTCFGFGHGPFETIGKWLKIVIIMVVSHK